MDWKGLLGRKGKDRNGQDRKGQDRIGWDWMGKDWFGHRNKRRRKGMKPVGKGLEWLLEWNETEGIVPDEKRMEWLLEWLRDWIRPEGKGKDESGEELSMMKT